MVPWEGSVAGSSSGERRSLSIDQSLGLAEQDFEDPHVVAALAAWVGFEAGDQLEHPLELIALQFDDPQPSVLARSCSSVAICVVASFECNAASTASASISLLSISMAGCHSFPDAFRGNPFQARNACWRVSRCVIGAS